MKAWLQRLFPYFWRSGLPRGIALFFALFALINLVGDLHSPGFDANLWWIDLRRFPLWFEKGIVALVAALLLWFAVRPPAQTISRWMIAAGAAAVGFLALVNVGEFYRELFQGNIRSGFPLPLSLVVTAAFALVGWAALQARPEGKPLQHWFSTTIAFGICLFLFPVLQVFCFGKTDYGRKADVIVVLGARAYADGRPSDALADRVRTAADLYNAGAAPKIIMSGGPGDGAIHETEAMKRYAITLGVKEADILCDEQGLNTQATVNNTQPIFKELGARRALVVSHFYHLPRIKMAYRRDGWDVYTVPAREAYFLRQTPYMVLREVAGLWVYYLRPLA